MASNMQMSELARNAMLDSLNTTIGSGGFLRLYTGAQPATADSALSGNTQLAQLSLSSTPFAAASAGVVVSNAITQDTLADATGTVQWASLVTSAGVRVIDMSAGISGTDLNFSGIQVVQNDEIQVSSITINFSVAGLLFWANLVNMEVGMAPGGSGNSVGVVSATKPFIEREVTQITAPGTFQWKNQQPTTLTYSFAGGDNYVTYCASKGLRLRAHAIIQDDSLPTWLTTGTYPNGLVGATPTQAQTLLYTYIDGLVSHYGTGVHEWVVANECFKLGDGMPGGFKNTNWFRAYGNSGQYLKDAFVRAWLANPTAKRIYNESSIMGTDISASSNRNNIVTWATDMVATVPGALTGIGIQGHFKPTVNTNGALTGISDFDASGLGTFIDQIVAIGLDVYITELDVQDNEFVSQPFSQRDTSVADRMETMLDILLTRTGVVGITTWACNASDSWLQTANPRLDGFPQRPTWLDPLGNRTEVWSRQRSFFQNATPRIKKFYGAGAPVAFEKIMPTCAGTGTMTGGGGGASGNLFNETFEGGTLASLALTVSSGSITNVTSSGTVPYQGSRSMLLDIPSSGSDGGCRGDAVIGSQSDIWVVFAMKIITRTLDTFPGTQKTIIFRNTGSPDQFGEMNDINDNWIWNWLFTDSGAGNIYLTELGSVSSRLGAWNTYKLHYHFLGSGQGTTITFGMNGTNVLRTIHTTHDQAGIPDRVTFGGTLNGGSGASKFAFDEIHIGSTDPGWP